MPDEKAHKKRSKANGEGSIFKLPSGKYRGVLIIGWKENGNPIKKVVSGTTHAQTDKKLSDLKVKYGVGLIQSPENVTLNEWGSLWLETYKSKGISDKTMELYRCIWK